MLIVCVKSGRLDYSFRCNKAFDGSSYWDADPRIWTTKQPADEEIRSGNLGQGALDDKASLMGIMEAVEALLAQGFTPRRTVYLAFGHDEEVRGIRGAMQMAALLKSRGVEAEYILDESGCIASGVVPGVSKAVALVGTAEKGYLTLELSVEGEGGHSSMPPPKTAIGVLSSAIARLEQNPFPARLKGPTAQMFEAIGPEIGFPMRFVFANQWFFGGLIKRKLGKSINTNGAIRTTCAATVIRGGERENVLPQKATALVNFRLFPGDTAESWSGTWRGLCVMRG